MKRSPFIVIGSAAAVIFTLASFSTIAPAQQAAKHGPPLQRNVQNLAPPARAALANRSAQPIGQSQAPPSLTAAHLFFQAPAFPTGQFPSSAAVGDFNGDGHLDVAIADECGSYTDCTGYGGVSVLLGNGAGSFAAPITYPVGGGPNSVIVADLNGDGKLDLVVANQCAYGGATILGCITYGTTVSVLLGNGDGTFRLGKDYQSGIGPSWVVVADFNGDGKLDLAVTNSRDNTVSILLSKGNGSFQPPVAHVVGGLNPLSVAVGDFNGDRKADLVVANLNTNTLSVLLGNGDGTFRSPIELATAIGPSSVVVGDFNEDGHADLALTEQCGSDGVNCSSGNVSVFLGNGDGTFGTRADYGAQFLPYALQTADFNGDGIQDLAVTNLFDNTASIYLGKGDGTFKSLATGWGTAGGALGIAAGDFNGDHKDDLATANYFTNTMSLLLGNGDGTFQSYQAYLGGMEPFSVTAGDFNNDGLPDLALGNYGNSDTVSIYLNQGDGTFGAQTQYTTGQEPFSVATGDFNGDGNLDLITANALSTPLTLLLGNGDGTFQPAQDITEEASANSVAVGDFNGDGKLDLVTNGTPTYTSVSVLLGNGDGTFQPPVLYPAGGSPRQIIVADVNGDGRTDLVTANEANNTVSVLLGNGNGTFQAPKEFAVGDLPQMVTAGDFNGDGKLDLATANCGTCDQGVDTVSILLGNGDGTFQTHVDYPIIEQPLWVQAGDLNGDGKVDLAISGGDGLAMLLGNGDGTFAKEVDFITSNYPTSLVLADLNLDGQLDVALANFDGDSVSVLLNATGAFVTLASSPNPSTKGEPVTFTATAAGSVKGEPVPTGTVTLYDGPTKLKAATLSNGAGTFVYSGLTVGKHNITVRYSGDSNFNRNKSKSITQVVNQ